MERFYALSPAFQPTLPARGATRAASSRRAVRSISTHAPRTGSDYAMYASHSIWQHFNPRSPHGERPTSVESLAMNIIFQPTLPARGATTGFTVETHCPNISTHAPRTGSDITLVLSFRTQSAFQPTLPARGATITACKGASPVLFQPTLPARGATKRFHAKGGKCQYFNPRSPHGERHVLFGNVLPTHFDFNPRSPHGERRQLLFCAKRITHFNPRSPHGERPGNKRKRRTAGNFNPRSPHGERQRCKWLIAACKGISTHAPRTGSDGQNKKYSNSKRISTHAPRTGSDLLCTLTTANCNVFQPTLPARGATQMEEYGERYLLISTHAPRTGSDIHRKFS